MLYGFKDISGINNCFFNCRVWDVVIPNVAARISSKAENTLIKGGLMAQQPFDWEVSQNWGIATTVEGLEKTGGYGVGMNNALANPFIRKTGICCATGPAAGTIQPMAHWEALHIMALRPHIQLQRRQQTVILNVWIPRQ